MELASAEDSQTLNSLHAKMGGTLIAQMELHPCQWHHIALGEIPCGDLDAQQACLVRAANLVGCQAQTIVLPGRGGFFARIIRQEN